MNIKQVSSVLAVLILILQPAFAAEAPDSIFNLKSPWSDQKGKSISLSILKGKPTLLAMIDPTCESSCPPVEDFKKIERLLSAADRDKVQFALFSLDSERDIKVHGLGKNWILAHGPAKSVRELAAALGVQYKKSVDGEFQSSNLITVLDKNGAIKKQQNGISAAEVVKLLGKKR